MPEYTGPVGTAVEITRVRTQVDPSSKGWGPSRKPDEWKIVVLLSDTPNKAWSRAWEETTGSLGDSELGVAEWQYKPTEQQIEIWAAEDAIETLVRQLDAALDRTNTRCAEVIEEGDRWRAAQNERIGDERAEAARLQETLDSL